MIEVSIGIKALNEEANIARCLASAQEALRFCPSGEIVLADSGSTDRTIAIARQFPVRIVQLANPEDRCCGAGAQLAFQEARGAYFYLLDGDMALAPDFLPAAIAYMEAHPDVAGVGGWVTERNVSGQEYQVRADKAETAERPVDHLYCGGLYRTDAVRSVGFLADRNLHAFEEFELGARLTAQGWKMVRLDRPGVDHYGHSEGGYALLWRRWKSGYAGGMGEVVRGAVGRAHGKVVLARLKPLHMALVVLLWWGLLLLALGVRSVAGLALLLAAPMVYFAWRRRSFRLGLYSFAVCNLLTLGLVAGFFRPRVPPETPLAVRDVTVAS